MATNPNREAGRRLRKSRFTKREVTRAALAAQAAGLNVQGVTIEVDGTVHINVGAASTSELTPDNNEWAVK